MERYVYIRVSAKDQKSERQFFTMQEQQTEQKNIYLDRMSGQDFSRPQYLKLLKVLTVLEEIMGKFVPNYRLLRIAAYGESAASLTMAHFLLDFSLSRMG